MRQFAVPALRILIADDHAVLRETLRLLLDAQDNMEVVGDVADGHQAIEAAQRLCPDLVIMDAAMPGLSGVEATRRLRPLLPDARVVILTGYGQDEEIISALEAGADGLVLKTSPSAELLEAVRTVGSGRRFLPQAIAERDRIRDFLQRPRSAAANSASLTRREREILQLFAEGHSNREIAVKLGISAKTVEAHKEHIAGKLGTRNRTELIRFAVRHGLLHVDTAFGPREL